MTHWKTSRQPPLEDLFAKQRIPLDNLKSYLEVEVVGRWSRAERNSSNTRPPTFNRIRMRHNSTEGTRVREIPSLNFVTSSRLATHNSPVSDSSDGTSRCYKSKELNTYVERSSKSTTHNIRRDAGNIFADIDCEEQDKAAGWRHGSHSRTDTRYEPSIHGPSWPKDDSCWQCFRNARLTDDTLAPATTLV